MKWNFNILSLLVICYFVFLPQSYALTGEEVYNSTCMVCHSIGVADSPKFRDEADWAPRFEARTLEEIYANAINGLNGHPAKGFCSTCTDEEVIAATDYLIEGIAPVEP